MRIKFEKGIMPERIGELLSDYIYENELIIGSVNVFIQLYDGEGKAINDFKSNEILVCSPTEEGKKKYSEYVAKLRRKQIKAVI
jgi:hypothetical protein